MKGLELLIDHVDGRLHAAIVKKGVVTDLYADPPQRKGAWASLYLGKVIKVDKNLDAAIIDLGNGETGLLPAKHVHFKPGNPSEQRTGITDLLKPGQALLVQIKSEAKRGTLHEQHKLPRLTTKLYVQGQYLVYCPLASQVSMSRKIKNEKTLALSTKIKGNGGWIVLPTAEDADEKDILAEVTVLQEKWKEIVTARDAGGDAPRLLFEGPNAVHRALFDYSDAAFDHIHAADRDIFNIIENWCKKYNPALATSKRLRLYKPEKPGQKLFDIHDIFSTLDDLQNNIVHLPSGGSMIIDITHALVVIDINQGSGSASAANAEAADEAYRQIHLRNLSGAILIDFIATSSRVDRVRLLEGMEKAFSGDNAQAQMHGFTRIGIAEITRKRRTAMYWEKMRD